MMSCLVGGDMPVEIKYTVGDKMPNKMICSVDDEIIGEMTWPVG